MEDSNGVGHNAMTNEERVARLEKTVKEFNVVVSGVNVQGGFQELKSQVTLEERVTHLEQLHNEFTIRGSDGTTVEGSFRTGFAVNHTCPKQAATTGQIPIGGGTPAGCPCTPDDLLPPFHDGMGGYFATVHNDCCAGTTTYDDPVDPATRFTALSAVNTACGTDFTGSNSCTFVINEETCVLERTSCEGEVQDPVGGCVNDCILVDCDCTTGSCDPNVTNTTTLSGACTPA